MDLAGIIHQLRRERDKISDSIVALERVAVIAGVRKRGRPPKWVKEATGADMIAPRRRGRPPGIGNKSAGASRC
jgi:hypothetical protein